MGDGCYGAFENFQPRINLFKSILMVSKTFGSAKQHDPTLIEAVIKQRHQLFLQFGFHVYQQIAAGKQVELCEWRVFDHILGGKHHHFANGGCHAVTFA